MEPRPGDFRLLWVPVEVQRRIQRIDFQRTTIDTESTRVVKLVGNVMTSVWVFDVSPVAKKPTMVGGVV